MKNKNFVAVISALALMFVIGLSGCASMHEKLIKGVPEDQWVRLFLAGEKNQLTKVDGQKMGGSAINPFDKNPSGGRWGTGNSSTVPSWERDEKEMSITATVPPGEHTITVKSFDVISPLGKEFTKTFNFEAGKFYLVELRTDPSLGIAEAAKASLIDDYVLIFTERNLSPYAYDEKNY